MRDNTERDTKQVIDRLATASSETSAHTFEMIDKVAKKASEFAENKSLETQIDNSDKEHETRLKTSENAPEDKNNQLFDKEMNETVGKLKTGVQKNDNSLNTIVNQSDNSNNINGEIPKTVSNKSKLKTVVDKTGEKIFKFNDNQGKVSKVATVVGKSGEKVSKIGKTIVRTSRELNKAISEDGTGVDYLGEKVSRKIKTKTSKKIKKTVKKVNKKIYQKIGKKLLQIAKSVIVKLLKMLISLLASCAEFILPIALIVLLLVSLGSVFGSSSDDDTLKKYSEYMNSIQEEYDNKVDSWMENNPNGVVIGVKGSYGQIDWRIPLAIIQATGAEINFDQNEKNLIKKFQDAKLLEKHEESKQIIENSDGTESEIPVLIITNGMYDDYIEWCKDNYTYISNFNKNKNITDGTDTWFSEEQLELLKMLYQSDSYAELLGDDFKTHTPSYGKTTTKANLNSAYYNSKNILATAGFKGQCTWYSHGRAMELFNVVLPSGNAQTWLNSAVAMGYETGTQPSYNSVVVLASKNFGHVAFVEAYEGESITISEGNIGNPCSNSDSCSAVEYANEHANELVRTNTYSSFSEYRKINKNNGYTIVGFIYLD